MRIVAVRIGNKYGPETEGYLESKMPECKWHWIRQPIRPDIWLQWNKLAAMSIDTDECVVVCDIDIMLENDYKDLFYYPIKKGQFLAIPSWWGDAITGDYKINGGFYKYYPKDCKYIFDEFMKNARHWQTYYIKEGITIGPINGEQYFVEDMVNQRLELITCPPSWVTRWSGDGIQWQFQATQKYKAATGNDYIYMGDEWHPDIKFIHFTQQNFSFTTIT